MSTENLRFILRKAQQKVLGFLVRLFLVGLTLPLQAEVLEDAALFQKLRALEDLVYDSPVEAIQALTTFITTVDPEKSPHLHLSAQTILLEARFSAGHRDIDAVQLDALLQQAKTMGHAGEAVRLILVKTAILKETDAKDKSLKYYAEADELCQKAPSKRHCPIVWRDKAYYHYLIGDYPKALESVRKGLSLIDKDDPDTQTEYQMTNNTLAIILDSMGDFDKALPIYERVYQYFASRKLRFYASVLAYNIGKGILLNNKGIPRDKALYYFVESRNLAQEVNDTLSVAWAQMGIGEYYFKVGQYKRALPPLRAAEESFTQLDIRPQLGECLLLTARVHLKLNNLKESEKNLARAKGVISKDRQAEIIEIRRSEYELAKLKGDFALALENLEAYSRSFEDRAQKDQQNQLNSLRVTLGLEAEEQRSDALKREVDLQQTLLSKSEKITHLFQSLFGAAALAVMSIVIVFIQQRRSHKRRLWMEQVLGAIDEGIVTVGRDLKLQKGYSKQIAGILRLDNESVAGQNAIEVLFQKSLFSDDERALFLQSLIASFDGGELGWELNGHQLPPEIVLRDESRRIISAHWQPVFLAGELTRVIAVFRDITESKKAEAELIQRRELQAKAQVLLEEVLSVRIDKVLAFMLDIKAVTGTLETRIADPAQVGYCLRELHTRKGVARTLGLKVISEAIHNLESSLEQLRECPTLPTDVQGKWQSLLKLLSDVEELLKFSRRSTERSDDADFFSLITDLSREAARQLQQHGCAYEAMVVEDAYHDWTPDMVARLRSILTHAITNSIDHGFIRARQKGRTVNPARFSIKVSQKTDHIDISFADNGVGLDKAALEKLAAARGFVPNQQQSLWDVVFIEGVSTADSVTERSGRGVGMAAIKEACESLQGTVHLSEKPEGGVILRITLPCVSARPALSRSG